MKQFFDKYGQGHEPHHAIEIMEEVLFEIKEKIEKGDPNVRQELEELSNMVDDFEQELQTVQLKPRKFQEYHEFEQQQQPYQTSGRIGYNLYPPYIYPPFFERGGQGRGGRGGGQNTPNRGTRNEYYPPMGRRGSR
jgi:hypothetical protein